MISLYQEPSQKICGHDELVLANSQSCNSESSAAPHQANIHYPFFQAAALLRLWRETYSHAAQLRRQHEKKSPRRFSLDLTVKIKALLRTCWYYNHLAAKCQTCDVNTNPFSQPPDLLSHWLPRFMIFCLFPSPVAYYVRARKSKKKLNWKGSKGHPFDLGIRGSNNLIQTVCWFPIPLWKVYTRHWNGCSGDDLFWSVLAQRAEKCKPDSMPAFFATAAASWPGKSIMAKDHQHPRHLEAKKTPQNQQDNKNSVYKHNSKRTLPCCPAQRPGQCRFSIYCTYYSMYVSQTFQVFLPLVCRKQTTEIGRAQAPSHCNRAESSRLSRQEVIL